MTTSPPQTPDQVAAPPARRAPARKHLIAAVLAGVVAAAAVIFAIGQARGDTIQVAAAAVDLRQGEPLTDEAIRWTTVNSDTDAVSSLITADQVEAMSGRVLTGDIADGQLIPHTVLAEPAAENQLRAMSLPVSAAHAAAGDLAAGDRVDVIAVTGQDASYVAVDSAVVAVGDVEGGVTGEWTVTVAVDDETALAAAQALDAGTVHVVRATGAALARPDLTVDGLAPDSGDAGLAPPAEGDPDPAQFPTQSTDGGGDGG